MSYEETVAELRERGLPPELIDHLRLAPEILDEGEDPDPYGLLKNVTPDDTGMTLLVEISCPVPRQLPQCQLDLVTGPRYLSRRPRRAEPDLLDDRFNVARSDLPDECFASLRS
jgi:hypothetical protein